jgi:hypothetical protein
VRHPGRWRAEPIVLSGNDRHRLWLSAGRLIRVLTVRIGGLRGRFLSSSPPTGRAFARNISSAIPVDCRVGGGSSAPPTIWARSVDSSVAGRVSDPSRGRDRAGLNIRTARCFTSYATANQPAVAVLDGLGVPPRRGRFGARNSPTGPALPDGSTLATSVGVGLRGPADRPPRLGRCSMCEIHNLIDFDKPHDSAIGPIVSIIMMAVIDTKRILRWTGLRHLGVCINFN